MAYSNSNEKHSATRFADLGVLPKRMLAPIEGYDKSPLVTLEEAVKPLIKIVPKVERNVFIVKQNCQEPEDDLTTDESASIMLYTYESMPHEDSLYVKLNNSLRSEQRKNLVPWFLYLRLVLTALARLPPECSTILRGVKEDLSTEYSKGKTFIWWGFSSCTSSIEVLEDEHFFGKTGNRTLFQIHSTTAKDIKNHSFVPSEDEVLLLPARQFQVTSCLDSGNGLHIIQLKELKPPYDLLEPVSVPTSSVQSKKSSQGKSPPIAEAIGGQLTAIQLQPQIKSTFNIPANATWAQNGVTIAGGHWKGDATNQLNEPCGLFVDDDQTVTIADWGNHRIIQWKSGDTTKGQVIAGGKGQGNGLNQLNHPTDVLIDEETDSLIICDQGNRRVLRWSRRSGTTQGEVLIDNICCFGLAMDEQRYLYVSNNEKHEVRRYHLGEKNGTLVAGGNGNGAGLNQLSNPHYLSVDRQQNVYVSEHLNARVTKWNKGEKEGIVVAGVQGQGNALGQLNNPSGLFLTESGTLYVTDSWNNRVMRWTPEAKQGTVIVGGNGSGAGANQFDLLRSLSFDRHGNLYVADKDNHRVQRFSIV
ncbi:unnamed protein product [Rotaria magnacalcarata]|uniref:NAD(P)(+)--arginine ADP-ribosyltransferase n=5 Tax=Rotaria magnacalcarata TaxID=392030 RepID=A0A816H5D0_9BILA|nr:unnamed protein product [Rotaria magnacalcarata]